MGRGCGNMESIAYVPYDPENPAPEHLEILEFFHKIYPNPELFEFALTLFSACLEGENVEQKFYIMTGSGGNGKSMIIDLITTTFGEYQETLPVTTFTRKRADGGSANPELILIKNKRFISTVEPEESEKINTSLMKQLSGGDVTKARGLFQDQDQFVVTARIFMACNKLPPVNSMDGGTWRRISVIDHVAKFLEPDKQIDPKNHIHHRDPSLKAKMSRWRPFFASILVWYYETRYLRGGLKEPACVLAASNKYKEDNDIFASFSSECIIKEIGAELKTTTVLRRFKEWMNYRPGQKGLTRDEITARMTEVYGKPVDGKTYVGIRISQEEEDISGNLIQG